MSYRLELSPLAKAQIKSWNFAGSEDFLVVDIFERLRTVCDQPSYHLKRRSQPDEGMVFTFSLIDPKNRCANTYLLFKSFSARTSRRCSWRARVTPRPSECSASAGAVDSSVS
jgi:hypothetical protein